MKKATGETAEKIYMLLAKVVNRSPDIIAVDIDYWMRNTVFLYIGSDDNNAEQVIMCTKHGICLSITSRRTKDGIEDEIMITNNVTVTNMYSEKKKKNKAVSCGYM